MTRNIIGQPETLTGEGGRKGRMIYDMRILGTLMGSESGWARVLDVRYRGYKRRTFFIISVQNKGRAKGYYMGRGDFESWKLVCDIPPSPLPP